MGKIFQNLIYIVLIIFLITIITVNFLSAIDVSIFGIRTYKVGSGSMEPELKVNDLIIIKEFDDYEVGDIVTINFNGDKVTHRIFSIEGDEVVTKGDANNTKDKPVTRQDIIGKVIYRFRVINYINYLLSKPLTWILMLIVGLFTITATTYMKQHGRHESEKKKGKHEK